MADSNWMFGTDNYQPTNFSVDDWVKAIEKIEREQYNCCYSNISMLSCWEDMKRYF